MMRQIIVYISASIFLFCASSCAKKAYYSIDTRTDIRSEGNYEIRWQVNPGMKGEVKIYASTDANNYPTVPFAIESIGKERTTYQVAGDGNLFAQQYFLMVFSDKEVRVVGHREVPTHAVTNLRDFGGYMTTSGNQIKWGLLYRAGRLRDLTENDNMLISALGIAHQIILADTLRERPYSAFIPGVHGIALLPELETNVEHLRQAIYDGKLDGMAVRKIQSELFPCLAYNNMHQFSEALHYLLDQSHYPVIITDEWGKDRTAFLVMLIQSVINISRADILDDYMLSNELLPVERLEPKGYTYTAQVQEAITEFYRSRPNDLHAIVMDIERKYGSVQAYLNDALNFTYQEQQELRDILTY